MTQQHPSPSAALIAEARKTRDHLRHCNVNSIPANLLDQLVTALAAAEPDAARWRRAVSACLPGQTPETAVECVSHLALADAEQEIARLREDLEQRDRDLYLALASLRNLEAATGECLVEEEAAMFDDIQGELKLRDAARAVLEGDAK